MQPYTDATEGYLVPFGWEWVDEEAFEAGFWSETQPRMKEAVALPVHDVVHTVLDAWRHPDGRVMLVTDGGGLLSTGGFHVVWWLPATGSEDSPRCYCVGEDQRFSDGFLRWMGSGFQGDMPERGYEYMS
tara:strand:- start:698 stop:1087 length:390 start_codon:yes stop_codon:yes gene_type:complete